MRFFNQFSINKAYSIHVLSLYRKSHCDIRFSPESWLKIGRSFNFQSTFRLCFWLRRSHSTILVTKISHVRIGWKIAKIFKRESNERRNTLVSLRHVTTVNLFYLACMIFGGKWFLTRLAWIWFSTFLNIRLSTM